MVVATRGLPSRTDNPVLNPWTTCPSTLAEPMKRGVDPVVS